MGRVQVLLHDGSVCTLSQLSTFLDATVTKHMRAHLRLIHLIRLLNTRHLELLQRRLNELLLNLLLEIDELEFDFRVYVALTLQRTTCESNDVALFCVLVAAHVLLAVRYALTDSVHIVGLSDAVLPIGGRRLVSIHVALLHPLGTLRASLVRRLLARRQFRGLMSAGRVVLG